MNDAFLLIWSILPATVLKDATAQLGRLPDEDQFEPATWALAKFAAKHTLADVLLAWRVLNKVGYAMVRFHEKYDIFLTPYSQLHP